jgi:hypothetical protein
MGAKRVDGRDNGHTAKSYANTIGAECEAWGRRALVPLDCLGNLDGDMHPLLGRPFKDQAGFIGLFARRAVRSFTGLWRAAAMDLVPAGGHGVMLWAPACRAAKQNFGPDLTRLPRDRFRGRRAFRPPPRPPRVAGGLTTPTG